MLRQWRRKARKALGLSASQDVGFLANMLSELRSRVEERIGKSFDSAIVTIPNLLALYPEDLKDAFEYVELRYLNFPLRHDNLYETSAAYAGYGNGLCSDYHDHVACQREQENMSPEVVMTVLYTRTVLTVSLSIVKSAFYLYEPVYRHLSDFSLGFDARSEEHYWDAVAAKLEQIMLENPYYERPAKVLLMGDSVNDEAFQTTLLKILSHQMIDLPKIYIEDSEMAAAKGAAEFAKRLSS